MNLDELFDVVTKMIAEPHSQILDHDKRRAIQIFNVMRFQLGFSVEQSNQIVEAVEEWMPKEHDTNSYEWNKCVRMLRERLWDEPE